MFDTYQVEFEPFISDHLKKKIIIIIKYEISLALTEYGKTR